MNNQSLIPSINWSPLNTTQRTFLQTASLPLAARSCVALKGGRSLAFGFKGACELSKSKTTPANWACHFATTQRASVISGSNVADELKDSAPRNPIRLGARRQGIRGKKCGVVQVAFSRR